MIDIGVNLTNPRFDKDRTLVIERAQAKGVLGILLTGTSLAESSKAELLCQQYPDYLRATVGVHPHDADNVGGDYLEQLKQLSCSPFVKAIGECGLDFNRNFSHPEQQKIVFQQQVQLASELCLPLFLHQRDAFDDWWAILQPYFEKVPAMVSHCFTGDKQQLEQCLTAGMYIGITGWVCDQRRGKELQDIVNLIPLNRLMIETDAPYLTPRTIKPKPKSSRNEPSYLSAIVEQLSLLMPYSADEIMWHSQQNAERVFKWKCD